MKIISTALLAAGLVSLAACGGGAANNAASNTATNELPPVDLNAPVDANAPVDLNAPAPADLNAPAPVDANAPRGAHRELRPERDEQADDVEGDAQRAQGETIERLERLEPPGERRRRRDDGEDDRQHEEQAAGPLRHRRPRRREADADRARLPVMEGGPKSERGQHEERVEGQREAGHRHPRLPVGVGGCE